MRQRVERMIARRIVLDAVHAGYTVSVFDGEEITVMQSTSVKDVMRALMTTDEDHLLFSRPGDAPLTVTFTYRANINAEHGWVKLIYGNDGWDVVNDYTTNLEHIMKGASALADKWGEM